MKILAIEKDIPSANWEDAEKVLKEEARHVYDLYLEDSLREIYFTESHHAILILECKSKEKALELLADFPLVKNGLIRFEVNELRPYTGFSRLVNEE